MRGNRWRKQPYGKKHGPVKVLMKDGKAIDSARQVPHNGTDVDFSGGRMRPSAKCDQSRPPGKQLG